MGWRDVTKYGAVGDLQADDTPAFQRALDDYVSTRANEYPVASLYVPPGRRFKITSPLNLNGRSFRIFGDGAGSRIDATFADFVFKKTDANMMPIHAHIRDLMIVNTHANGGGISIEGSHELAVSRVYVQAQRAMWYGANMATGLVDHVTLRRAGTYAGSYGFKGAGANLIGVDAQGFEIAFQLSQGHSNVYGGRSEVCGTAFLLGVDPWDGASGWNASVLEAHVFEACDVGIEVRGAGGSSIRALTIGGTTNSPSGDSQYGIKILASTDLTIDSVGTANNFARAGIWATESNVRLTFRNVSATNAHVSGLGKAWDIQDPENCVFEHCNFNPSGTATQQATRFESATVRGLAYPSAMSPPAKGKNLRGLNVSVPAAATFVDVLFPPVLNTFNASVASATPTTGGSLAAGTYYYMGVVVNDYGETLGRQDKVYMVAIAAPNNATTVVFHAMDVGKGVWRRRLYRGRSWATQPTGYPDFDGYYETPLNSDAPFTDTGAAFAGLKNHGVGERAELGAPEPDASYGVEVTPQWNTTAWVTAKATTGFRINFGTAPGVDSAVDWFLVR